MMMTLIIAFRHHCSCELEPMQSSFLMISSELQVLGNWRRSLRTFCLQDSLALGSSELTLILVDCLCWGVSSCHDLQNFNPLEAGDVHSELLVFSLVWRFVLQTLQVLNAEAVQQNFWS